MYRWPPSSRPKRNARALTGRSCGGSGERSSFSSSTSYGNVTVPSLAGMAK